MLEALEAVVRDGLPDRGARHVGAPARPHPRVAVEGGQADAHLGGVIRVAAEEMGAALAAEALLEAAVGMSPGLDELLALDEAERPPSIRAWADEPEPVRRWQRVQWQ